MTEIILMQPSTPGNIGAVARVMKNFNLKNLTLIDPKTNHLSLEALSRAKHAKDILKKAKIKPSSYLKSRPTLIATTSQLGSDYNLKRTPLTPKQILTKISKKQKVSILFGSEGNGLTNDELSLADIVLHIPSSPNYPTLNLSHSVTIICYELFQQSEDKTATQFTPASKIELNIINKNFTKILNQLTFTTKEKKDTQKTVWKHIFGRALLTKRESFAVIGFLKKLIKN